MSEFLYRYKFTMKPGTPCWSSAELRQSVQLQTITFLPTTPGVTSYQEKNEGSLNPIAFKLDVRKIDPIRVPDNPTP